VRLFPTLPARGVEEFKQDRAFLLRCHRDRPRRRLPPDTEIGRQLRPRWEGHERDGKSEGRNEAPRNHDFTPD
jgi:hypothetical protein